VAKSIPELSEKGFWFCSNDYKWEQIANYSKNCGVTAELPKLCDGFFNKGLLEWRLSTESAVNFLADLSTDNYLEISYAAFTSKPVETIRRVLTYIEIDDDSAVIEFARENVYRKTSTFNRALTELETKIGGKLLPVSMDDSSKGLTIACSRTT